MTKVQLRYGFAQPLDDSHLEAIDRARGIYGLQSLKMSPSLDSVTVEYDASRLTADDVDKAIRNVGLPAVRTP